MRYKYQGTTQDGAGRIIASATITVYLAGLSTLATIYAASAGGSAVTGSAVSSDSVGQFLFWVDEADYANTQMFKIVMSKSGYASQTWDDLDIIIPEMLDEDNMASNSATKTASQQSIKVYADAITTALGVHGGLTEAHGATGAVVGTTNSQALSSKTLTSPVLNGTLSGTAFLDEDDMVSNSAIATISQQSAKAYIDARFNPVGSVIAWTTETAPTGYLECNGAAISRTTYAALFAVIGDDFGVGDTTTTFNLPDFRGRFLRGWDHAAGLDPDAATRTNRGDTVTGDHVGTKQADGFKSHLHTFSLTPNVNSGSSAASNYNTGDYVTTNTSSTGGNETRPANINIMYCIKY